MSSSQDMNSSVPCTPSATLPQTPLSGPTTRGQHVLLTRLRPLAEASRALPSVYSSEHVGSPWAKGVE